MTADEQVEALHVEYGSLQETVPRMIHEAIDRTAAIFQRQSAQPGSVERVEADGILPCPFCGSDPVMRPHRGEFSGKVEICCDLSACFGPEVYGPRDEAIALWNHRTPATSDKEARVKWMPIESAPKGYPTLESPSEWFLARPAKGKYGPKGQPQAYVIRRAFGHGFGQWECTGDAYYKADFFDAWMPLPEDTALPTAPTEGEDDDRNDSDEDLQSLMDRDMGD